jgi:hypothetical protein
MTPTPANSIQGIVWQWTSTTNQRCMMTQPPSGPFAFDEPATYRIRVQGRLKASWSDRLEGMTISVDAPDAGPLVTTLEGELPDQAALVGVLKRCTSCTCPCLS